MSIAKLVPLLNAAYQRDQSAFNLIRVKVAALEAQVSKLRKFEQPLSDDSTSFEQSHAWSNHLKWREAEARRLMRLVFELQSDLQNARQQLKKSFGRLEAARAAAKTE